MRVFYTYRPNGVERRYSHFRQALLLSTAVAILPMAATSVFAQQEATPPQTAQQSQQPSQGLEEVVVTARKRKESSQNVPVAVTALSAAQLAHFDINNIQKIAASTPQLVVTEGNSGSGATISLRGIGSSFTSIGIEQSVAVNLDGAYYGQGRVINEGFYDESQVEILKGPQALFFGKNATAGVVSIKSNDPGDEFESMARVGYETTSEAFIGEGMVSVPVTDTLGVRLALSGTKMFGGYTDNIATSPANYTSFDAATGTVGQHPTTTSGLSHFPMESQDLGRLTVKWRPIDNLTATTKIQYDFDQTNGNSWQARIIQCPLGHNQFGVNNPATCYPGFISNQINMPADVAATSPLTSAEAGRLNQDYQSHAITEDLEYTLPWATLSSVTNYQTLSNTWIGNFDYTGNPGIFAGEDSDYEAFSEEARILTKFDFPVNFLGGVLFQQTHLKYDQDVFFGVGDSAAGLINTRYTYLGEWKHSGTNGQTISPYGQIIYDILPNLELTAGARFTSETKDSFFIQPFVNPILAIPLSAGGSGYVGGVQIGANQHFYNVSPDASLTWKPDRDITVYVSYKTGYKSGGFSDSGVLTSSTGVNDFAFGPEIVRGFEGGIKTTWLDNTLRLNLDLYHYRYDGLQVDFFNSILDAFQTQNAGNANTDGVEFETEYKPPMIEGLTVRGSVDWNKADFRGYEAPCYTGETPSEGCVLIPGVGLKQNLTGVATPDAPRWVASLGVNYETPINDNFNFGFSTDLRYSDTYLTSGFGNPAFRQAGYINVDAAARVSTSDDQWQVAVIGKNLSDNFVRTLAIDSPSSGGGTGTTAGIHADQSTAFEFPRTVEIQATWRFTPPSSPPAMPATAPMPEAAPAAPPAPLAPAPEPQRAFQVFFDFDKSDITDAAASVIQQAAANVKAGNHTSIMVTGHTDTVGSVRYNQKLSERRAAAVKKQLMADGVSGDEIMTKGVGKTELLVPTPDGVREPQNRRAEIVGQ